MSNQYRTYELVHGTLSEVDVNTWIYKPNWTNGSYYLDNVPSMTALATVEGWASRYEIPHDVLCW